MDAAFLLIAAKPGRRPSEQLRALSARADAPDLGFRADHHVQWSDAAGGVVVGAWERRGDPATGSRVHVDADGLALVVGTVRRQGEPWRAEGEWAADLATAARALSLAALAGALRGVFTVVVASPTGSATVASDPLGHRCTYVGETDDAVVVGSRASLVATAISGDVAPALDVWSACWPAFAGYMVGDRTGFAGVRVLGPGARFETRAGAMPTIERDVVPWHADEGERARSRDELVDEVRADLAEALRACLTYPAGRHVLGLTGGKDSRLLLAVMLGEGITDDYEFVTIGPPSLGDVQVASTLADRFGLRHHVEFPQRDEAPDYETLLRESVAETAGLVNAIDLHAGLPARDEVRVTGLGGEILRNFRVVPERWRGPRLAPGFSQFNGYGRLGLVRPELADDYEAAVTADVLADPAGATDPVDQLGSFLIRNRVRSARLGPSEELMTQQRMIPLSSPRVVHGAFAIGSEARQAELVGFEVTRRCCPALVEVPFAGPVPAAGVAPFIGEPVPQSRFSDAEGEPFVARVRRTQFDRRRPVLRAVFEARVNPAWEVIDPGVALDALERFGELNGPERRQLFGAATAALWLGR